MLFRVRESADVVSSDNGMNYSLRRNRAGGVPLALLWISLCFFEHCLKVFEIEKKRKKKKNNNYRIKTQTNVQSSSDQLFFTLGYRSPGKLV